LDLPHLSSPIGLAPPPYKNDVKDKSFKRDNRNNDIEQEIFKISTAVKCYKCQGYWNMAVNCPSPVKIAIIDGALIEAPKLELEKFIYYANEEIGDDFDDDHEGED